MAKDYRIRFSIDDAPAQAATKRSIAGIQAIERAANKAAQAVQRAHAGGGTGGGAGGGAGAGAASSPQARAATDLDALQDRLILKDYNRRARYEAQQIGSAERAAAGIARVKAREAAQLEAIQDRYINRDYKQRVAFEKQKIADAEQAAERIGAANDQMMKRIAIVGVAVGAKLIHEVAGAFAAAKQSSADMARNTLDTMAGLREIAAIKEKMAPDPAEVARHLSVRTASGLTHAEAVGFQAELYNTLGTVGKEKFSDAERAKLEVQGAVFASRTGGGPAAVKNRATVLGLLADYLPGKPTAEQVVSMAESVDVTLGKGAGSQEVSTGQYQKLLTSLTSEGMTGYLHDPRQAAALTSIASKFDPEASATSVMQAVREVRNVTKMSKKKGATQAQGETLKKAGITEHDDPITGMRKLFKYAEANFGDEAFPAAMARRGFGGLEGTESMARFYEQYQKGNFDRIINEAMLPIDPTQAARKNKEFLGSDVGRDLVGQARVEAAKVRKGFEGIPLTLEKQTAEEQLIGEGIDTDPLQVLKGRAASALTGGAMSGRDILIEQRALSNVKKRAGVEPGGGLLSPETMAAGTSLLAGGSPMAAIGAYVQTTIMNPVLQVLLGNSNETVANLRKIADSNEKMAGQQPGAPNRAPAPLPVAPRPGAARP